MAGSFLQGQRCRRLGRKYEDGCRLAKQTGNLSRRITGKLHLALLHGKLHHSGDAERICDEADVLAQRQDQADQLIDLWKCRAKLRQMEGRIAASHAASNHAISMLKCGELATKRANTVLNSACARSSKHASFVGTYSRAVSFVMQDATSPHHKGINSQNRHLIVHASSAKPTTAIYHSVSGPREDAAHPEDALVLALVD